MDEKMSRKPFVREVPKVTWFFDHPRYMGYMARELTCLFIGAYTVLLVVGLARLAQGREAYEAFLTALQAPGSIVFHGLALVFAVYHSATWFNLTPKALPVQIGEVFLPDWIIAGLHYAAWIAVSVAALILAGAV
jgi:fumarate reductase subunit C